MNELLSNHELINSPISLKKQILVKYESSDSVKTTQPASKIDAPNVQIRGSIIS